jgi:DNA polymerase-4
MDILRSYSPTIQAISIDEAFLDLSHLPKEGKYYAREIQKEIKHQLNLPSSLGIASNKLVAKIASNIGKARHKGNDYPNAILEISPGKEAEFLAPLATKELWGVGPKTAEKLANIGIHTIGDIAKYPFAEMERRFGQIGQYLHKRAQGIDDGPVLSSRDTKSVSHEVTYGQDTFDEAQLRKTIHKHSASISKRLKKLNLYGSTVKVKIRWPDFSTITRQQTMKFRSDRAEEIEKMALNIFFNHWKAGKKVRLLGVGVSELGPPSQQMNLWEWDAAEYQKNEQLENVIKDIEGKFGDKAIRRAGKLKT